MVFAADRAFAIVILPPLDAGSSTNRPVTALRATFLASPPLFLDDVEAAVAIGDICPSEGGSASAVCRM